MSWNLLPGDLIVLIGQYLGYRNRRTWTCVCRRFWIYRSALMIPSEELKYRVYNGWKYLSGNAMLSDASSLLICRDMPTVCLFFDQIILGHHFMYPPFGLVYFWIQKYIDPIMNSPRLSNHFLNPNYKSQRVYRMALVNANTYRSRNNNEEFPVYLDAVDWRLVLENWCRNKYLEIYRVDNRQSWLLRNMSMMNYLFLQTHTDPNVDPVVSRIIKRHYRLTQEQVYKAVGVYIRGDFERYYHEEWETLLSLLLKQFPLSTPYRRRTKLLCQHYKDWPRVRFHSPKSTIFPFDV